MLRLFLRNFAPEYTDKATGLQHKTIYLIRHGETDYNRRGVVQGSGIDSDLNEMGRAQAMAFFQAYQHVPFAKLYISGLKTHLPDCRTLHRPGHPLRAINRSQRD